MRKRFLSFILAGVLFHQYCWAQIEQIKNQPNCSIDLPPENSGENSVHGLLIKIYPRKSTVAQNYTGCQTMWIQFETDWQKFSIDYFEGGKLNLNWSLTDDNPSTDVLCKFKDGKLAENEPKECSVRSNEGLSPSLAPGCSRKSLKEGQPMNKACRDLEDN